LCLCCFLDFRLPSVDGLHAQYTVMIRSILYAGTVALIVAWLAALNAQAQEPPPPKTIDDVWQLLNDYGGEGTEDGPLGLTVKLAGSGIGGAPQIDIAGGAVIGLAAGAGVRVNNAVNDAAWVRWQGQNVGVYNAYSDPLRVRITDFEGSANVATHHIIEDTQYQSYADGDSANSNSLLRGTLSNATTQIGGTGSLIQQIVPVMHLPSGQQTSLSVPFLARGNIQASTMNMTTAPYYWFRQGLVFLEGIWFLTIIMRTIRGGIA